MAGAAAMVLTVTVCAVELPHELFAVTEMVPPVEPAVVIIVAVVDVPVQPLGKVQVYDVAPFTGFTENVLFELDAHTLTGPNIDPGIVGAFPRVTACVCADELPQALFAITVTFPPPVPTVVLILSVVELPLQLLGNVHV